MRLRSFLEYFNEKHLKELEEAEERVPARNVIDSDAARDVYSEYGKDGLVVKAYELLKSLNYELNVDNRPKSVGAKVVANAIQIIDLWNEDLVRYRPDRDPDPELEDLLDYIEANLRKSFDWFREEDVGDSYYNSQVLETTFPRKVATLLKNNMTLFDKPV